MKKCCWQPGIKMQPRVEKYRCQIANSAAKVVNAAAKIENDFNYPAAVVCQAAGYFSGKRERLFNMGKRFRLKMYIPII